MRVLQPKICFLQNAIRHSPLHSVTTPTVGVGYLASSLKAVGIQSPILDLNIRLKRLLEANDVSKQWLDWIFPFEEQTFGGELLLSQACFDRPLEDVIERVQSTSNPSFRDFFLMLSPESMLESREAVCIRSLIRRFLESSAEEIARTAGDWLGFPVVETNQLSVIFLLRRIHQLRPDLSTAMPITVAPKQSGTWLALAADEPEAQQALVEAVRITLRIQRIIAKARTHFIRAVLIVVAASVYAVIISVWPTTKQPEGADPNKPAHKSVVSTEAQKK